MASVSLPTPVNAPEFREALGVQVSLLARGGVQHAELHLNPAEMGPISVQIALDGQQAQVHFGVDSAQTRQIVETGLPELAAALREAGLTLSGGGVSQHAGGQRQGSGAPQTMPQHSGQATTEAPPSRARSVRVAAGGIDTYA
jgi:flagellar hook-length control protein FliK